MFFWCSRPVLEACQGLSEAQSPKRDLQPPEFVRDNRLNSLATTVLLHSLEMCLLNSLATAVRRAQGQRFLTVASTRQSLRLFSDLEVHHAAGNAASDMRSHFCNREAKKKK